jgi:TolB protein
MQLTDSQGSSYQPAWSPDGRQIVFASDRNRDSDIFIMGADGANERLLTRNDENAEDRDPAWSPDEQWIAFSSNRDTVNFQIYLIDPVTENVVRVTRNAADDIGPVWLPVAPPRE